MAKKGVDSNAEKQRLEAARTRNVPWKKWGPYLSERQWGTVREDYSPDDLQHSVFTSLGHPRTPHRVRQG